MNKLIIAILLIIGTTNVNAEPSRSVEWLMDEPASLFDIGMIQMRMANQNQWTPELIKKISKHNLKEKDTGLGSVVYNWEKNTIDIGAYFIGEPSESTCSAVLSEYKNIAIPKSSGEMKYTFAASKFAHINYTSGKRPKSLDKDISNTFVYTVGISSQEGFGGKSIYCSSRIDESKPSFLKFGF